MLIDYGLNFFNCLYCNKNLNYTSNNSKYCCSPLNSLSEKERHIFGFYFDFKNSTEMYYIKATITLSYKEQNNRSSIIKAVFEFEDKEIYLKEHLKDCKVSIPWFDPDFSNLDRLINRLYKIYLVS